MPLKQPDNPGEPPHLNEQPWYDYEECIRACALMDKQIEAVAGQIFVARVSSVILMTDQDVFHPFYALKLCEGGEDHDRYRMCLFQGPLEAQRILRGLEEPKPKKKIKWNAGSQILRPSKGVRGWTI